MIQRLQSLYLVAAALLLVAFVVLGDIWASGLAETVAWLSPVAAGLAVLTAVVALVAVALFKDRSRQRQIVFAAQWLDLALVVVALVGLVLPAQEGIARTTGAYLVALAPVVAYVLLRMARQAIAKDIELVRSMDRLR